jgi:hypothetical protein
LAATEILQHAAGTVPASIGARYTGYTSANQSYAHTTRAPVELCAECGGVRSFYLFDILVNQEEPTRGCRNAGPYGGKGGF